MKNFFKLFLVCLLLFGCDKHEKKAVYPCSVQGSISINALESYNGSNSNSLEIQINLGSSYSFNQNISKSDTKSLADIAGIDVVKLGENGITESYSDKFFLKYDIDTNPKKTPNRASIYFKNTDDTQEIGPKDIELTVRISADILKNNSKTDLAEFLDVGSFKYKVTKNKGSVKLNNGVVVVGKISTSSPHELRIDIQNNSLKTDLASNVDFTEYFTLPDSLKDKGLTFKTCPVDDENNLAARKGQKSFTVEMSGLEQIDQISNVQNGLDKIKFTFPKGYLMVEEDMSCENEIIFVQSSWNAINMTLTPFEEEDDLNITGVVRESITPKKMNVDIIGTYLSKDLKAGDDLTSLFYINSGIARNGIACKVVDKALKLSNKFVIEFTGKPIYAGTYQLYGIGLGLDIVYIPYGDPDAIPINNGEPLDDSITIDYPRIDIKGDSRISDYIGRYKIGDVIDDLRYTIKLYNENYEFDSESIKENSDVTENFRSGLLQGLSAKVVSIDMNPDDCSEEIIVSIYGTVTGDIPESSDSNVTTLTFAFSVKDKDNPSKEPEVFVTPINSYACLKLIADDNTPSEGEGEQGYGDAEAEDGSGN